MGPLPLVARQSVDCEMRSVRQMAKTVASRRRTRKSFRRITQRSIDVLGQILGRQTLLAPDLLAVAVALEQGVVTKAETHHVQVELAGKHTRGHTTVDWFDRTGKEPNVNLVLEMHRERLWGMMRAAVS